ncbi:hypothetical protein [Aliiroseovarius sp. 2305UL8-7]|uniref:hypothetical protein n=1 Tax=Aliiroseovarius conchicola TaxID=3121637 RepID=UPI003528FA38
MRYSWICGLLLALGIASAGQGIAQERPQQSELPMTYERLGGILFAIDPELQPEGLGFQLKISDVPVLVFTDPAADRMRAMVRIGPADALDEETQMRLLQANFDAVLDARYAVASGQIWSVFIHPLSPLETRELVSGLAQTINAARSFGTAFSGGGIQFGGGDSSALQQELLDELTKKGVPL